LGPEISIDWSSPRLILIAETFSEYDKYAVNRIGANIELWTFRLYSDYLLYLDPLFITNAHDSKHPIKVKKPKKENLVELPVYTLEHHLGGKKPEIIELYNELRERIFSFAEEGEIIEKYNKMYIGFKHGKNFCEVRVQANALKVWLDIVYDELDDPLGIGRDVSDIGHYGTGQVEMHIPDLSTFDDVIPLIEQSFLQTI